MRSGSEIASRTLRTTLSGTEIVPHGVRSGTARRNTAMANKLLEMMQRERTGSMHGEQWGAVVCINGFIAKRAGE